MVAFYIGNQISGSLASTMAFATLCLARLFEGFDSRGKSSLLKLKISTNWYSLGAFLLGTLLLAAVIFITPLHSLMDIDGALSPINILQILCLSIIPFAITQIARIIIELFTRKK